MVGKKELAQSVAMDIDISERCAKTLVDLVFEKIMVEVANGEEVNITGFGKFYRTKVAERTTFGHVTPAHNVPKFKPGKTFKETV